MHFNSNEIAASAVIVDSIVTAYVGWRLNRTARRETAKAAETVKPAIQAELQTAVVTLLPALAARIAEIVRPREEDKESIDKPGEIRQLPQTRSDECTGTD